MPRFLPWKKPKAGVQIAGVDYSDDGGGGGGGSYTLPTATASRLGGVKVGSNIDVAGDGTISTHAPYTLPTASADTLGGIKVGSGLTINDGVLSASGGGGGGTPTIVSTVDLSTLNSSLHTGDATVTLYDTGLKCLRINVSSRIASTTTTLSLPDGYQPENIAPYLVPFLALTFSNYKPRTCYVRSNKTICIGAGEEAGCYACVYYY